MPRIIRIALCALCSAMILVAPAVAEAAKPEGTQTLKLSAHRKNISGYAGPINTAGFFPTGKLYVAEVSGAISYYARRQYIHPNHFWNTVCGEPLVTTAGSTGDRCGIRVRAAVDGAVPAETPSALGQLRTQLQQRRDVSHPAPLGGPFTAPTPGHVYSYPIVGATSTGCSACATTRVATRPRLTTTAADHPGGPAVAADCSGTGYVLFGKPTEAACVAAVS